MLLQCKVTYKVEKCYQTIGLYHIYLFIDGKKIDSFYINLVEKYVTNRLHSDTLLFFPFKLSTYHDYRKLLRELRLEIPFSEEEIEARISVIQGEISDRKKEIKQLKKLNINIKSELQPQ